MQVSDWGQRIGEKVLEANEAKPRHLRIRYAVWFMNLPLLRSISISGVMAGFIVMVATSIVLSIVSPLLFSDLVKTGDLDILLKSTGPLSYALVTLFVASVFGIFICGKVANSTKSINSFLVVVLYAAFTYWLSTSPSNIRNPYPEWYVAMSYLLMAPGAIVGHYLSVKLNKNS